MRYEYFKFWWYFLSPENDRYFKIRTVCWTIHQNVRNEICSNFWLRLDEDILAASENFAFMSSFYLISLVFSTFCHLHGKLRQIILILLGFWAFLVGLGMLSWCSASYFPKRAGKFWKKQLKKWYPKHAMIKSGQGGC